MHTCLQTRCACASVSILCKQGCANLSVHLCACICVMLCTVCVGHAVYFGVGDRVATVQDSFQPLTESVHDQEKALTSEKK